MAEREFINSEDPTSSNLKFSTGNFQTSAINDTVVNAFQTASLPLKLVDLSTRIVSKHYSYRYVESKFLNMPEPIARQLMYWSFPRCQSDIIRYSYFDGDENNSSDVTEMTVESMDRRFVRFNITKIVQVGFCVQGIVSEGNRDFGVSLIADRCVITAAKCSCGMKNSMLWCLHAKTLALYRLYYGSEMYVPIFQKLDRLTRDQLQMLLQYLIIEHYGDRDLDIVTSVQKRLTDCSPLHPSSEEIQDVTAFLGSEDKPSWHLDTINLRRWLQGYPHYILDVPYQKKIIEMVKVNDKNGLIMLRVFMEERTEYHRCRFLDVELVRMWTFALAAPHISKEDKASYCSLLMQFPTLINDSDIESYDSDVQFNAVREELITYNALVPNGSNLSDLLDVESVEVNILLMPLSAGRLTWDDQHLKYILSQEVTIEEHSECGVQQTLLWREHLSTSYVRWRALQVSGHILEATRLSFAVVRAIKDQSRKWNDIWRGYKLSHDLNEVNVESVKDIINSADGEWMSPAVINNRVDPLQIFSWLENAPEICSSERDRQHYQLAIEAIIVIFSQSMISDEIPWQVEEKWMNIVHSALKRSSDDSASHGLDHGQLRDLFQSLLEAGPFTLCGNFSCFEVSQYEWGLLMARTISIVDKALATKFALVCLKFRNSELTVKQQEVRRKLLRLILSVFSEDTATEALNSFFKLEGHFYLTEIAVELFVNPTDGDEMEFVSKSTKDFVFGWLLEVLRSSMFTMRKVEGSNLLKIASHTGFQQTVYVLRNWERHVHLSESTELNILQLDFMKNLSKLERKVIKEEGCNLALRFAENYDDEKKEIVLECLQNLFFSPYIYQLYRELFTERDWKFLKQKMPQIEFISENSNWEEHLLRRFMEHRLKNYITQQF